MLLNFRVRGTYLHGTHSQMDVGKFMGYLDTRVPHLSVHASVESTHEVLRDLVLLLSPTMSRAAGQAHDATRDRHLSLHII